MKRLIILAAILVLAAGCVSQTSRPIEETSMEQHPSPQAKMVEWKANHGEYASSEGIEQCQNCHQPEDFCNKCHSYVGDAPILEEEAATTGGEETGEEAGEEAGEETAEEAGETQEASLHGVGKCDQCHDAPTMSDMAAGEHAEAFQKQPDIHKPLCSQCHEVETHCTKCHTLPEVMK